jgi:ribosomal protein S18 acetylase RimI-like enzyme
MSPEEQPTSRYQIEQANWRDLLSLRRLEKESFKLDAWPLPDLLAVLLLPGIIRLKAVADGDLAGFIGGERRMDSSIGWIVTLAVSAPYRRKGIARALIRACEKEFHTRRYRLSVRKTNLAAIRLYQSEDYAQVDIWPGYYSGGEDALIFEKIPLAQA